MVLLTDSGVITGKVRLDYLRATSLSVAESLKETLFSVSTKVYSPILNKRTVSAIILSLLLKIIGAWGGVVVKALRH